MGGQQLLYSLRGALPDLDNFTLEPITFGQNLLSPAPTIQCPPTQFLAERHGRWLSTAARGMLEIIPLMVAAILEEPPVLMIIDALRRITRSHTYLR